MTLPMKGISTPSSLDRAERRERRRQRSGALDTATRAVSWIYWVVACALTAANCAAVAFQVRSDRLALLALAGVLWCALAALREAWERARELKVMIDEGVISAPWQRERREEPF